MNTIDATLSMMEAMPEEARVKVMQYTRQLFVSEKPASPFVKKTEEDILADLSEAHGQIMNGEGIPADEAMQELGAKHGFI